MSSKPFLSADEQITKLKKRNLSISNDSYAKEIIMKENYYNIINGYKYPFLKRDLRGELYEKDQYIDKSTFNEIYALHNLDRELRNFILGYLLKFETHFKTSCSYHFSDKYRNEFSYLNYENYSTNFNDLKNVLNTISTLSREINTHIRNKNKKSYMNHYLDNHKNVPLWVFVNTLSLGTMSYFFVH